MIALKPGSRAARGGSIRIKQPRDRTATRRKIGVLGRLRVVWEFLNTVCEEPTRQPECPVVVSVLDG